jgi:hypothetical protein
MTKEWPTQESNSHLLRDLVIRSSFVLQRQFGSDPSGSVIFPSHMLDNIVTKRAAFDLGRAFH